MTISQLQKDIKKNLYKLLYGAAVIIFMTGCWITRNQMEIANLKETVSRQEKVIESQQKLIDQHEWSVVNFSYRIDRLDNLSSKTKK